MFADDILNFFEIIPETEIEKLRENSPRHFWEISELFLERKMKNLRENSKIPKIQILPIDLGEMDVMFSSLLVIKSCDFFFIMSTCTSVGFHMRYAQVLS
jgi:hypothetical protein